MLDILRKNLKWIIGSGLFLVLLWYGIFSPESPVTFFEEKQLISDEPDAFIVNGAYTSYGKDGKLESILRSTQAKHYPKTNIGLLANPSLELYQNGELRWKTTSRQGEFDVTNDTLTLSGDVNVFGETNHGTPLTMTTESVNYANKSSYIHTDQAVKITSQVSEISAVGMTANVEDRTVQLLSKVKGKYEPKKIR
jgi:lipopolysaccharide export system protein LptC